MKLLPLFFIITFGASGYTQTDLPIGKWFYQSFDGTFELDISPQKLIYKSNGKVAPSSILKYSKNHNKLNIAVKLDYMDLYVIWHIRWLDKEAFSFSTGESFTTRDEALKACDNFDPTFQKVKADGTKKTSKKYSGLICNSEKRYAQLKQLPALPKISERNMVAYLKHKIAYLKEKKKKSLKINHIDLNYMTENYFIAQGYSPFQAKSVLVNGWIKYYQVFRVKRKYNIARKLEKELKE
ncbi:hypothetical protein BKI52_40270 [marine bacterium AO1-C]|nr:hypothetical protein BKI52_40270 [marine bacterium AO1-C]